MIEKFETPAGFGDPGNRWEQLLWHLNILSCSEWTGDIVIRLNKGRVTTNTLQRVNDVTRPILVSIKKEEMSYG